jgi:hypothetical protein
MFSGFSIFFFSQQLDAARRLVKFPAGNLQRVRDLITLGNQFNLSSADQLSAGARWEKPASSLTPVLVRVQLNDAVAEVLSWSSESSATAFPSGTETSPIL